MTTPYIKTTSGQERLPTPVPGNWYVDRHGVLFKVRALVYQHGLLKQAVIHYPRGRCSVVRLSNWPLLIFRVDSNARLRRQAEEIL